MKKTFKLILAALALICVIAVLALFPNPVRFLNGETGENIKTIEVFNGNTGKRYTISDKADISHIIKSLQTADFGISGISLGYVGTKYNLEFTDKSGNTMEKVIINSADILRKDPFFYKDKNSALCVEYLDEIEYMLDKTPPEEGAFMVISELSKQGSVIGKYIALSDEQYESCINDSRVLPEKKPALYNVTVYKDINELYSAEIPSPPTQTLLDLAKAMGGYVSAAPEDIADIVQADLRLSFDGEQTESRITDADSLQRLEQILGNAEESSLGACPYTGELTLIKADGSDISVHLAMDSCDNIILGTNSGYRLNKGEKVEILKLFPQIYEWTKDLGIAEDLGMN